MITFKLLTLVVILAWPSVIEAQGVKHFLLGTAKNVALDPTTYIPATINFTARKLDWDSSQIFFRNGFVEYNEEFTITGKPSDSPISYAQGNRKIIRQIFPILTMSVINNASVSVLERLLSRRYSDHKKLIKILAWTEKIVYASYWSYELSHKSFNQWQQNKKLARELGLK